MVHEAIDIAYKIISKTDTEYEDVITNLKLQKLLYYVQGYHIAFFENPLFNEDIVAWQYGPVVPTVYDKFKHLRGDIIKTNPEWKIIELPEREENLFNQIYGYYSRYSAIGLMNLTHNETPWKETEIRQIISKEKIKNHFKKLI